MSLVLIVAYTILFVGISWFSRSSVSSRSFLISTIINIAINSFVDQFWQTSLKFSLVQILRNDWLGNCFLKAFDSFCHNAIQKSWAILLLAAVSDSTHFVTFMLTRIIVIIFNHWHYYRKKWQLSFSIIYISLISKEMEYFICLMSICNSLLSLPP